MSRWDDGHDDVDDYDEEDVDGCERRDLMRGGGERERGSERGLFIFVVIFLGRELAHQTVWEMF
jgi:hypothetical protein